MLRHKDQNNTISKDTAANQSTLNPELVDLFQVEELEKRYEMGWVKGGSVEVEVEIECNPTMGGCHTDIGIEGGVQF